MADDVTQWDVPEDVKATFNQASSEMQMLLLKLGELEAQYTRQKAALLVEFDKRVQGRMEVVLKAATDAGLDMSRPWNLDINTMKLSSTASPASA